MRIITFTFSICFVISCNQEKSTVSSLAHWDKIPQELKDGITAHGGLEQWSKMKTLEYSFPKGEGKELHQVDLPSRKVRISHDDYTLGFDGKEVWITPNKEAMGSTSPRFYHNLIFYFYAIPFVLGDPGINYEVLPQREINGKTLNAIKITYDDGIGDAPEDYYIAHFDAVSNELYLLLYTVTYFSGTTNEKFSALIYDEWKEVNGLKVPKVMKGYKYEADTLGAERYVRIFDDIKLSEISLDNSLFEIPDGAVIDSLISH